MSFGANRLEDGGGVAEPERTERRRIDVTDMDAEGVTAYVRERVHTDRVSLESRGARTYLVVEE